MDKKILLQTIGFKPKENTSSIYSKTYQDNYTIEVDFEAITFYFGGKIKIQNKDKQNITKPEDWVVLECVNRLLEKGYKPENIQLEKVYPAGHGNSGRLDICVNREDGSEYLLIECKTYGKEFDKEFNKIKKDGGQLFTYFKFSNKSDLLMLYSSEFRNEEISYKNEIIKIEDVYRTGDVKDFYDKWNKLTKDNGVWENPPYDFKPKSLNIDKLIDIKPEDSSFIFNRFLEILRHNVVSDKPNAFNKIFNLFLCKIKDEKDKEGTDEELDFQWIEGKDDDVSFQLRLTDLFKNGMDEFLKKDVTDFSDKDFENQYASLFAGNDELKSKFKKEVIYKLRLEKNNEFAIKEVYDKQSFTENAKVVKEVVELLQKYKIRYTKKQQYLSDFFELLLTTGLKQESGQYFTPVPIAQFIIKSLPIDKIVEDKLTVGKKDELLPYVMDYAAGSGHFLTESMHEIQRILLNNENKKLKSEAKSFLDVSKIKHFGWASQYVYGIEKDYRLVKVGKVGCYLHGDGLANVIHSDGLANFNHKDYKDKLNIIDKDFKQENKQFDIIVSNPPYSVSAFKNASRDYYKESDFELYDLLTDNSSEIESLFIERAKQLLKDGGVAGIILPSSILSNSGIYSKSREIILKYFDIIAIAELGSNTFMATGTNTVTLFLKRRDNYLSINTIKAIERFFTNLQDVTINGIEKPISKYVNYIWQEINFEDYISLIQNKPNENILKSELYKEFKSKIKLKKKTIKDQQKEFFEKVLEIEAEKLLYFILAYNQKVVLVKSGEKDAEKSFLGYEFSNRRGSEGIHPIQRGKNIEDCTKLFDPVIFDNPKKASTYIYKAFQGDYSFPIDEELKNNITIHNLTDMLTFDRVEFEKNISLSIKKKVKIESKWELKKLGEVCEMYQPKTITSQEIKEYGKFKVFGANGVIGYYDKFNHIDSEIAITCRGATCGTINYTEPKSWITGNAMVIRPKNENLDKRFLYNLLKFEDLKQVITGTAQPQITRTNLEVYQIPLPSLEIQKKIVSEIEVLETKEKKAKEEVEKEKKKIETYVNSAINNKLDKLGNLALIGSGGTPSMKVPEYWDNGNIPWLKSEVCKEIYVYEAKDFITEVGLKNSNAKYFEENSTLIALVGATKGKTAFLKFKATTNQNIAGISSLDKNIILDKFIFYILKSMYLDIIKDLSQYDMLNLTQIRNIKIPVPPIAEQQKIVSENEKIEERIKLLEQEIEEIPKHKEEILKKYL